jgi:hypothetical protein
MQYSELKEKWEKNKNPVIVGIGFLLVFLLGFGVGSYDKNEKQIKRFQANYTTKLKNSPVTEKPETDALNTEITKAGQTNSTVNEKCVVKGNISAKGKKTYHVVGGAFYEKTKAEQCFNTEAEARSAGFTKSSR